MQPPLPPVRVKVYGLFAQTRRQYRVQALVELAYGAGLLALWWPFWPQLREKLTRPDVQLPAYMALTVAVLNELPWIMVCAAAVKAVEMWFVSRRFALKEAQRNTSPSSSPEL